MKINFILTFVLASLLLTSCASVFTGSKRNVLFESNPSGAKVFVNGMEQCVSPCQIKVKKDDRVDFRLENFKERVVIMDADFNLVAILNGFSIIGWGVDALTGSLQRVNTKYVKVDLEKGSNKQVFNDYMDKGNITKVAINTDNKTIETTIVLKNN
jgi:hypothetical protein